MGSQNCGGIAPTTAALLWMGAGSLGMTSWESKEGESPFVCQWDHLELCLVLDDEPAGSLWVRLTRQTNTSYIVVDVCGKFPDKEVDKDSFR